MCDAVGFDSVVNRADLRELEGVVTREDVLSRYQADAVAD